MVASADEPLNFEQRLWERWALREQQSPRKAIRLSRWARTRSAVGGAVQGFLWGVGMFVAFLLIGRFRLILVSLVIWGVGGVLFGTTMWRYNRYMNRRNRSSG